MTDALKVHSKSLRYTLQELKEARRTPLSCDSSANSRDGCRPLPTFMMKRFLSLAAGFAFTSREYTSQHLRVTASET